MCGIKTIIQQVRSIVLAPDTKPLELLERVIKANTNKGDVVLDIFSGSGSTAIAANNTGRIFWGCEKDTEYYEKSLIRIEELSK